MGVSVYAALSDAQNLARNWFMRDDAYYYFKVAQNISEGRGSTFDGINPTNGYHPLWLLICVPIFALARFDLILPLRVLLLVMGALSAGTSILLYRLMKRAISPPIAALAAIYWATNYLIQTTVYQQGLETGIAAFCIAWLLYALSKYEEAWSAASPNKKEIAIAAVIAALVMFSRLDLVFLAALIGLRVVFRKRGMGNLLALDLLFILTSVLTSFVIRVGLPQYYLYSSVAEYMAAAAVAVGIPIFYFFGLYNTTHKPLEMIKRSAAAVILNFFVVSVVMMSSAALMRFDVFPRSALLYYLGSMFVMIVSSRLGAFWFANSKAQEEIKTPLRELKENWKTWLVNGSIFYGILFGALAAYMLINLIMFKTPMPVSGQIKRWWGSYASRVYGGAAHSKLDFYGISPETDFNAWAPLTWEAYELSGRIPYFSEWRTWWQTKYTLTLIGMVALSGIVFIIDRRNTARRFSSLILLPLLASAGIQVLSYNISGYAGIKEWYWVSQLIIILLCKYLLLDVFTKYALRFEGGAAFLWLIACAVGIKMSTAYANYVRDTMPHNFYSADTPMMDAVPFLEANTPPGAIIGMTGGGNAGYFIHDRAIVNMDGLINSYDYFKALQSGHAAQYLARHNLDYIFANPGILEGAPYRGQFTGKYENGERFGGKILMRFTP
jgi:hypothetical protein